MRVLLLNYEYPPLGGGAANATKYLLGEFSGMDDVEVDLVTSAVGEYREEQLGHGVMGYFLDIGKRGGMHEQSQVDLLRYSWKALWFARKLKRSREYDVVHAFFGIPCGVVAMFLRKPYIVSLRGTDVPFYNERFAVLDRLVFRWLSAWLVWPRAAKVVANSEGLRGLAEKSWGGEIGVIENGVAVDEYRGDMVRQGDDVVRVLYVGRLIARKNVDVLIRAFAEVVGGELGEASETHVNAELEIVGEGGMREELEELARELGVADRVKLVGRVEHDDLPEVYEAADVMVVPSKNEGMSNAVLEAMASGLPVVVTDVGGTKELVDDKNGRVVDVGDVEGLAEVLKGLCSMGDEERKALGEESRRRAEGLSWRRVAERYLDVYTEVAK